MGAPELIGAPPPPVRRDWRLMGWLAASIASWVGTSAWTVALSWQAVRTLPADRAGVVVAVSAIPQALLALVGGVIADRCSTRTVMAIAQVAHAATLVAGSLLWRQVDHWWLLLALGIVFGSITGLSVAASATLGRQLVAAHDLATVSSWNQIGARLARMAGAPIGAALVAARGLPAVMVVDAATFLLAAGALALVRPRYRIHHTPTGQTWRAGLVDGFAYLGADRRALVFVIGLCGLNVFSSPLTGLGVPLRITAASWPATTLGVAEAVFSGAALAGSLGAALIRTRHQVSAAYLCLIVQGLAYAAVAATSLPALYAAMGIIGLTAGLASVWLSATFVQVVDAAHLGRVASISNLGDLLLVPVAAPAFGALTSRVGIGVSPLILAAGMVTMCGLILARPDIRAVTTPT